MSKTEIQLAFSPIANVVYASRTKDNGKGFVELVDIPYDVTKDFLSMVILYGKKHNGEFTIDASDGETYRVTVTKK